MLQEQLTLLRWTQTVHILNNEDMETTHKYIKEKEDSNTLCYLETLSKVTETSNLLYFPDVQRNATRFEAN